MLQQMTRPTIALRAAAPTPIPPDLVIAPAADPAGAMRALLRALTALDEGDEWANAGDRDRALAAYGEALDLYLMEGLPVIAASVAQRMIRRYPDVVRARLTLAVLSLAEGLRVLSPAVLRTSRPAFDGYVRASRYAGCQEVAARHLRAFAEATESAAVREQVAELLQSLGDREGAEAVYVDAYEEREGIRPGRRLSGAQPERWFQLLATN